MCTVSVIPMPHGGFRVVANRDESHLRPPATEPEWTTLPGGVRALWPRDGLAGGTWIGASDRGRLLAILNYNLHPAPRLPPRNELISRGLIIPRLLEDERPLAESIAALELDRFAPFRLVAIDGSGGQIRIDEARWDRTRLTTDGHAGPAACFASSGLGDHLVQVRIPLFEELVIRPGPTVELQDRFHAHRWPDRSELSVLMHRPDARTISVTMIEAAPATGGRFELRSTYRPVPREPVSDDGSPTAEVRRASERIGAN